MDRPPQQARGCAIGIGTGGCTPAAAKTPPGIENKNPFLIHLCLPIQRMVMTVPLDAGGVNRQEHSGKRVVRPHPGPTLLSDPQAQPPQ